MTIGQVIQAIRKEKGYTQRQLAEKCGMAIGTIQQYELGKREPRQEQLQKLATAMGISVAELYGTMAVKQSVTVYDGHHVDIDKNIVTEEQTIYKSNTDSLIESLVCDYKKRQELLGDVRSLQDIIGERLRIELEDDMLQLIVDYFKELNLSGKKVAVQRVEELTEIPRYTKKEEEPPDKKE